MDFFLHTLRARSFASIIIFRLRGDRFFPHTFGHGRGAVPGYQTNGRANGEPVMAAPPAPNVTYSNMPVSAPAHPMPAEPHRHLNGYNPASAESSNSLQQPPPRPELASSWTLVPSDVDDSERSASPTRGAQDSQTALVGEPYSDARDVDGRGRSVKRSIRNTFTAAEQYASSLLFGRNSHGNSHDGVSGSSSRPRGDVQRY